MSDTPPNVIKNICRDLDRDPTRLMDVIEKVQQKLGWISPETISLIARELAIPRVEVEGVVTFYAFMNRDQKGKSIIRLCEGVSCCLSGGHSAADSFRAELGIDFGQTTPDGKITLEKTSCIGLCDQGPGAIVNGVMLTRLSSESIRHVVRALRDGAEPQSLVRNLGSGHNSDKLIGAMVNDNIRKRGPVIFQPLVPGSALKNALTMTPVEVIRDIKTARLRGRGGAGFPTGMKWDFARQAESEHRFVLCNADEGEPGTFKDRVLLTECPDMVFEGMTIAGYAIGADAGIIYLRGEYEYLKDYLESVLEARRSAGLLGHNVMGKAGFAFDIRIQLGAGAYICGEETALINSCEGKRGEPRDRPPFPAQAGYLGLPTIINNVETFCCVARILEKGAPWFSQIGSQASSGTKLFSVSGDCKSPGIYELPYGITVKDLLAEVGGEDAIAVQIGGPSGQCIAPAAYSRTICFDDIATGGSIIVIGPLRNLLDVVSEFMGFFIEESCGWCVPCRVGNTLLKERVDKIRAHGQDHEPVRHGPDFGQPGAHHPAELPAHLRAGGQKGRRLQTELRPRRRAGRGGQGSGP